MPYDPRMLQLAQRGIGMMGPGASPFDRTQQPRPWWDQPPPQPQARPDDSNPSGQPANQPPNPAKQPQPSLLQMLMLGAPATYSGTPRPGAANPWGWLGGLGQPPGASGGGYR
jgi:hypothetical protein